MTEKDLQDLQEADNSYGLILDKAILELMGTKGKPVLKNKSDLSANTVPNLTKLSEKVF